MDPAALDPGFPLAILAATALAAVAVWAAGWAVEWRRRYYETESALLDALADLARRDRTTRDDLDSAP